MNNFGWQYPPGSDGPPDNEGQCDECGNELDDDGFCRNVRCVKNPDYAYEDDDELAP